MKKLTILLSLLLCLALAGCGGASPAPEGGAPAPQEPSAPVTAPPEEKPDEPAPAGQTATLYIGTRAGGFTEYPLTYQGELTAETLIQGIADLTGWDLTLAEPVTSGKGGMSVCLSRTCALFAGPPDPQKEEFYMFGLDDLAPTLLDSIQKTLQEGFTGEGGDPDALDIWYYLEGEEPLALPGLELSWPIDRPYQWDDGVYTPAAGAAE